jgi:hypothetical protein
MFLTALAYWRSLIILKNVWGGRGAYLFIAQTLRHV